MPSVSLNANAIISNNWTLFKATAIVIKNLPVQYDDDGDVYTIFAFDSQLIAYVTTIWKGTLPDSIIAGGYSQVQNNADKSEFENNYKANANARISDNNSQRTVLNNVTVVAGGNQIFSAINTRQVNLFINCTQAFTGAGPGIQFTIAEVDPGDQTTVVGSSITGASITSGPATQSIALNLTTSSTIKVSWIIVGSGSPTFPGTYVTLVSKPTTTISGVDIDGVERILKPDTSGHLLVSGSNAINTAVTVDPLIIGGVNPAGVAGYSQLASDNSLIVTQGINRQPIYANGTIDSNGISNLTSLGVPMVNLFVNIKNAPTGTNPAITFSMYEIDPGDLSTAVGTSVVGSPLMAIGTQIISLPITTSGMVQVSWTLAGASASFTGVYVTALMKDANVITGPIAIGNKAIGNPIINGGVDTNGNVQALSMKLMNGLMSMSVFDERVTDKLDQIILILNDLNK